MREPEILETTEFFRIQALQLIPKFNKNLVINTDQTGMLIKQNFDFNCKLIQFIQLMLFSFIGCQYQSTFNRTLEEKGTKTIYVKQEDMNKVTHSYTAQYALTLSGKILPKVFVCLQESTGKFGPRVQKIVDEYAQKYNNVIITSSKSGKLTTVLCVHFL